MKTRTDDSIPDDYVIANADCASLARKLGELTRSDQVATLSAKLNEKQREKAMKSIDDAASKIESRWVSSCQDNLVGKVTEAKSLKCAMDAKTVNAFDVCLNGEAPGPKKK